MVALQSIVLTELRIFFTDRLRMLISLLIVPIGMTVLMGLMIRNDGSVQRGRVDFIDNDRSTYSRQLIDGLRRTAAQLTFCPLEDDKEQFCQLADSQALGETLAQKRLQDHTTSALIVIPAGFGAALDAGDSTAIIYRTNDSFGSPNYLVQTVQSATEQLSGALVARRVSGELLKTLTTLPVSTETDRPTFVQAVYERAVQLWSEKPIRVNYTLTRQESEASEPSGFGQSVPGMSTIFVMYTVFGSMMAVLRDRRNKVFARLTIMPITRAQILGGRMLAWFTIGLIQFAAIFGVGLLVGINLGHDMLALLLLMVAYTACVTALSFFLVSYIKTEGQLMSAAVLLTFTLAPLGGSWWPLEVVPHWILIVGHISPVAWVMDGFHSLMYYGGNLSTILPSLMVLAAFTLLLFVGAVLRFHDV